MSNKEKTYISFIKAQLRKGNVSFKNVFTVFESKFQLSEKTFSKYWKIANIKHSKHMRNINEAKADKYTQKEIEAFEANILNRFQILELVSAIALSEVEKISDRLKALDLLNKMQGYYTPIEVEHREARLTIIDETITITKEDKTSDPIV